MPRLSDKRVKAVVTGILGSLGLILFYFGLTFLVTRDPQFPLKQFLSYKYLMTPLVIGFGIQVGLFQYLRLQTKTGLGTKVGVGASGGVSGLSMVACCIHHLTEILPFLGAAGLSFFLSQYQKELLLLGIFSNLVGIIIMIRMIRKARCQV